MFNSKIKIQNSKRSKINIRIYGKKYGGLHLIIDNDYPISCFNFNPFLNIYGIDFAIRNTFHFSLTFDFNNYEGADA